MPVRDVNNRLEGPDIKLDLTLPDNGQITRSSGAHRTGAVSAHLVTRNNSDILAENDIFRIAAPQSLIQSDSQPPRDWINEGLHPFIELHYQRNSHRKVTAIVYHRLYRPPDDPPI